MESIKLKKLNGKYVDQLRCLVEKIWAGYFAKRVFSWLLDREALGKDHVIFLSHPNCQTYLINQTGISSSIITSNLGLSNFYDTDLLKHGMMEVSPDNKLVAMAFPRIKAFILLRFNKSTGTLERFFADQNPDHFVADEAGRSLISLEFSLNSKVLYVAFTQAGVQQYNLSNLLPW